MRCTARVIISLSVVALAGAEPAPARAVCNLIPAEVKTFPSTLGEVTTPFGFPCPRGRELDCAAEGQVVTVRREAMVFAKDPSANKVTVQFRPPDGPVVEARALPPVTDSRCTPENDC